MGQFLEKPNTDKQVTSGSGPGGIRYGFAAMQGWRIEMEDAHSLFPNVGGERYPGWSFFAIFDGHAGDKVSKHASEHLWRCIESHLPVLPPATAHNSTMNLSVGGSSRTKSPSREMASSPKLVNESSTLSVRTISDALKMGFFDMDQQLRELPDIQDGLDKSGSTAVSALITPQYTFLVNVGDSRAILIRDNQVQMATMDHKPSNEKERGLVIIQRVNGSLAVSRALGDFEYKADPNRLPQNQLVSPEADVFVSERDLKGDQHLVLACDGIWDVMSNDDVCQFVSIKIKQGRDAAGICADLLDTCLAKGSKDNMSVIIVSFPQQSPGGSGHSQFSPQSRTDLSKSRGCDDSLLASVTPDATSASCGDVRLPDDGCVSPIWTSCSPPPSSHTIEGIDESCWESIVLPICNESVIGHQLYSLPPDEPTTPQPVDDISQSDMSSADQLEPAAEIKPINKEDRSQF